MKTNQLLHRSLASLLLVAFSIVLLPKHIFADHHHAAIICLEIQEHIEETDIECDLCDFVLPIATVHVYYFLNTPYRFTALDNFFEQEFFPLSNKQIQPLRGPPIG